jgi:putative DNA primase/helicase
MPNEGQITRSETYAPAGDGEASAAAKKPNGGTPKPIILVKAGERHEAADDGIAALEAAGVPFYQRDRMLVRVCAIKAKASDGSAVMVPAIVPVSTAMLGRELGKSARWEKFKSKNEIVRVDPPREVVEQIAGMVGEWPFLPLVGVIGTPTLRPNGSVLTREGYDPMTGLFLLAPPPMPSIAVKPSKTDALEALNLLTDLLVEFPFADAPSKAVALSKMMTVVLRPALAPAVPLHADTSPAPGTGKSYLADLASGIAIGERCAVIAVSPKPEETEKRLIAAALAGHPIIAIDNCNGELAGDFLCQVTERPTLKVRPLGSSIPVTLPNTVTVFANGNNLVVVADLVRRVLICRLDANMENPEERDFRRDPFAMVMADRGRYIAAVLTIACAYLAAGKPGVLPPLPSYSTWSNIVRSALVWLGCADPVSTIATARADDPLRQARAAFFGAWATELGLAPASFLTSELIQWAMEDDIGGCKRPRLRTAMFDIARRRRGDGIDPIRLGQWLNRSLNNVVDTHKLTVDRSDAARPRWSLS